MRRTGVIADDFTGATDIAMAYTARGHRAVVVTDRRGVTPTDADVLVVASKTRTAPVDVAVAQSLDALGRLQAAGCERFVFKYCSTFDSTERGNIGPVLDALRTALGASRVVVAPAFPDNGRTVYRGHLFVGDDLLEHSSMRRHPLTPMTRSRITDILRPQTAGTVAGVALPDVRQGPDELRRAIDATGADAVVVDAVDDDDLAVLAAATVDDVLVSGSAGVALGVARGSADAASDFRAAHGARLVLSGSASSRTRKQLAHAIRLGMPLAVVDAAADVDTEVRRLAAWVAEHADPSSGTVLVVSSLGEPDAVPNGGPEASDRVERVIAGVAAAAVRSGVGRLLVAGGETSGAVVERLGIAALGIGPSIAPGVCWSSATTADGDAVSLALKSGNFGAPDMFTSAWEALA